MTMRCEKDKVFTELQSAIDFVLSMLSFHAVLQMFLFVTHRIFEHFISFCARKRQTERTPSIDDDVDGQYRDALDCKLRIIQPSRSPSCVMIRPFWVAVSCTSFSEK